jgi:hypothetical protein
MFIRPGWVQQLNGVGNPGFGFRFFIMIDLKQLAANNICPGFYHSRLGDDHGRSGKKNRQRTQLLCLFLLA